MSLSVSVLARHGDIVIPKSEVKMIHLKNCPIFLVFMLFVLGCHDNPTITSPIEAQSVQNQQKALELTQEEAFSKIKSLYPNAVLDEEFRTLKDLTTTQTYLDFLSQEYHTEKPFQTYENFLETAQPDQERYLPFLEKFLENPSPKDIAILHQLTQQYRNFNATQYHLFFDENNDVNDAVELVNKKGLFIMENRDLHKWLEEVRLKAQEGPREAFDFLLTFFAAFENFVIQTEKADTHAIQELFVQHGEDDGTIWLALLEPSLTGQIIKDFTNIEVFLNWVKGDFFLDRPLEIPPQALEFRQ